jgi:MoaA/NifB/PqqE/SkfB family radical SAM enzyme
MSSIETKKRIRNDEPVRIQQENLSIEVTTRCTNDCRHCFARAGRENLPELSWVDAQSAVDEAYEIGYRHLHITGGEPLLWPHLFELLDHAAEKGYETCLINTNGSLVSSDIANRFASNKLKVSLSISLHGPEELHDDLSGPGSFQMALQGIKATLEAGVRVTVFTVARRALLDRLPHFAQFLFTEFAGIDDLTIIQMIRVPGDAVDLASDLLNPGDFLQLIRIAALLNLYGYRISVLENPLAKVAAERMGLPWLAQAPPLYRAGKIVLMADGSLTLAHSSRESLGIYKPGMLGKVLDSKYYQQMIAHDTKICPHCEFHDFCIVKGLARPSEWFRDEGNILPFCKRVMNLTRNA